MARVFFTTIEANHTLNPGSFANRSLPKDQQRIFHVIGGKIYCPIENTPLDTGTAAIITSCCQAVFAGNGFLKYVEEHKKCPHCNLSINPNRVRPVINDVNKLRFSQGLTALGARREENQRLETALDATRAESQIIEAVIEAARAENQRLEEALGAAEHNN